MHLFVTGGSRGIGREIVRAAVRDGHRVVFTYVQAAAEAQALSAETGAQALQLDVRDSAAVEAAAERASELLSHVDAVVANAGVIESKLAMLTSDEDWRRTIDTNLSGAFYTVRAFLPEFLARKDGRFVIVSSLTHAGIKGNVAYSASKAGLLGLSAAIAQEYGGKGVRCNVVIPGLIDTSMSTEAMSEEWHQRWLERNAMGRLGRAQEVAEAVLFLLSDKASYINGRDLVVDGGMGM